jgi:alcohol dehydrogenase
VVLKSTVHDPAAMSTWPIVVDEITVIGSRCGPFEPALALLARGAVNVDPLMTCVTGLDDFEHAFREAATGLKTIFAIS